MSLGVGIVVKEEVESDHFSAGSRWRTIGTFTRLGGIHAMARLLVSLIECQSLG